MNKTSLIQELRAQKKNHVVIGKIISDGMMLRCPRLEKELVFITSSLIIFQYQHIMKCWNSFTPQRSVLNTNLYWHYCLCYSQPFDAVTFSLGLKKKSSYSVLKQTNKKSKLLENLCKQGWDWEARKGKDNDFIIQCGCERFLCWNLLISIQHENKQAALFLHGKDPPLHRVMTNTFVIFFPVRRRGKTRRNSCCWMSAKK